MQVLRIPGKILCLRESHSELISVSRSVTPPEAYTQGFRCSSMASVLPHSASWQTHCLNNSKAASLGPNNMTLGPSEPW